MHHHWSKPAQVLRNPALSKDEKRALLAGWASDANAIADAPSLRRLEDGTILSIDNILEALKALDAWPEHSPATPSVAYWTRSRTAAFPSDRR